MKKTTWFLTGGIILLLAGGIYYCWTIRETPTQRRNACRAAAKHVRSCAPDAVAPYLRQLSTERFFTVRFGKKIPWMRMSFETRVPIDYIGQITEDAFFRFAGQGTSETADAPRLKELLAFSHELIAQCSDPAAATLRERQIDACFFLNDFDSAIAIIEKGIPGRSKDWTSGTVAKLRAHKAMKAGDDKEVVKQLLIFDAYLKSDEMKDCEEYDQTTGVMYSLEWIMARNYMRCAEHSRKAGDAAGADKYKALAVPCFKKALEKAKEDKKSLETLKEEMKSFGL